MNTLVFLSARKVDSRLTQESGYGSALATKRRALAQTSCALLCCTIMAFAIDLYPAKADSALDSQHSQTADHNGDHNVYDPYSPSFLQAGTRLTELRSPRFTLVLLNNVVNYQPLVIAPQTQVHMGFYSGPGNHGSLVRLLDAINNDDATGGCIKGASPNCAIWDEGAGAKNSTATEMQYPQYVRMLDEQWYTRAAAYGKPFVMIYARVYKNINQLDNPTANQIWGAYSQRYPDMAREFFHKTGKQVHAWCYVQNANPARVFYLYEFPQLQQLEKEGVVKVYCAKNQDASWKNLNEWTVGTGSAACPAPSNLSAGAPQSVSVATRK